PEGFGSAIVEQRKLATCLGTPQARTSPLAPRGNREAYIGIRRGDQRPSRLILACLSDKAAQSRRTCWCKQAGERPCYRWRSTSHRRHCQGLCWFSRNSALRKLLPPVMRIEIKNVLARLI